MARIGFHARLPRHEEAQTSVAKLRDYLLDPDHPVGGAKAIFFARVGFSTKRWPLFERELRRLIARKHAWALPLTVHGQKFQVRGTIRGPWNREARVVTIWIAANSMTPPRLVTAYPRSTR